MRLVGEHGEIAIEDDTAENRRRSIRFESGVVGRIASCGLVRGNVARRHRELSSAGKRRSPIFDEAALCLSVIRRAYQVAIGSKKAIWSRRRSRDLACGGDGVFGCSRPENIIPEGELTP